MKYKTNIQASSENGNAKFQPPPFLSRMTMTQIIARNLVPCVRCETRITPANQGFYHLNENPVFLAGVCGNCARFHAAEVETELQKACDFAIKQTEVRR